MSGADADEKRLWADHEALARLTEPERPFTRRSFSPLFSEGRAWLERRFRDAGLETRIDAGGNLIGRLEGSDPDAGTLMTGSHSDTVPEGGRFDGISGVLAGIEAARCLAARDHPLRHAFEVVDFLAEEASECGVSCVGSRAMTGWLDDSLLAQTFPDGRTLAQALEALGGDPRALSTAVRDDVRAFLELHIEQGPVLERADTAIGVVGAIVGITRIEAGFRGQIGPCRHGADGGSPRCAGRGRSAGRLGQGVRDRDGTRSHRPFRRHHRRAPCRAQRAQCGASARTDGGRRAVERQGARRAFRRGPARGVPGCGGASERPPGPFRADLRQPARDLRRPPAPGNCEGLPIA